MLLKVGGHLVDSAKVDCLATCFEEEQRVESGEERCGRLMNGDENALTGAGELAQELKDSECRLSVEA